VGVYGERGRELSVAKDLDRVFGADDAGLAQYLGSDGGLTERTSFSRFTMLYSLRKMLVKPRLGMRRWSGIWPPSKPRIIREPLRERWPLCPRVDVLPMPEPIPRPTRFLPEFAFFGARIFDRFIIARRCRDAAS